MTNDEAREDQACEARLSLAEGKVVFLCQLLRGHDRAHGLVLRSDDGSDYVIAWGGDP